MEAAAAPPARPVPTTMTLYLRLLAGFTSFRSKRCLSQVFSIGPVGHLPSSITLNPLFDQSAGKYGNGNNRITGEQDEGNCLADCRDGALGLVSVPPHGLEKALDAVGEMEEQGTHRRDVHKSNAAVLECGDNHGKDIITSEGVNTLDNTRRYPCSEVQNVEND